MNEINRVAVASYLTFLPLVLFLALVIMRLTPRTWSKTYRCRMKVVVFLHRGCLTWNKFSDNLMNGITAQLLRALYSLTDLIERHRQSKSHSIIRMPPPENDAGYSWHIR